MKKARARGRPKKPSSNEQDCKCKKAKCESCGTCTHCGKCKCRPNAKKKSGGKSKGSTSTSTGGHSANVARKVGGKRKNSSSTSNKDETATVARKVRQKRNSSVSLNEEVSATDARRVQPTGIRTFINTQVQGDTPARRITPQNQDREDVRTPTTVALEIKMNGGCANEREQQLIAETVLRNNDPYMLHVMNDETPPKFEKGDEKASLKRSDGKQMNTLGDVVEFMNITNKGSLQKRIGKLELRANDEAYHLNYPKEFQALSKYVYQCMDKIADVAHPSNPSMLLSHSFQYGMKTLKIDGASNSSDIGKLLRELYNQSNQRSVENRTIGAAIQHLKDEKFLDIKMPIYTAKQRCDDLASLKVDGTVPKVQWRRQRKNSNAIEGAVEFILSTENAQTLSWGNRTVQLDTHEAIVLPKVTRKKLLSQMWKEYEVLNRTNEKSNKLQRTSFLELAATVTFANQKSITCVDYVEGNLCNDPVEKLQDIIDLFFAGIQKKDLTNNLNIARNFLKNQYDGHLKKDDGDGFHDMGHALTRENLVTKRCKKDSVALEHESRKCTVCSGQRSITERATKGEITVYKRNQRLLYQPGESKRESVVEVMRIDLQSNVTSYFVKAADSDSEDTFLVYHHQLRELPCVEVNCCACKFPFWLCETIKNQIKARHVLPRDSENPLGEGGSTIQSEDDELNLSNEINQDDQSEQSWTEERSGDENHQSRTEETSGDENNSSTTSFASGSQNQNTTSQTAAFRVGVASENRSSRRFPSTRNLNKAMYAEDDHDQTIESGEGRANSHNDRTNEALSSQNPIDGRQDVDDAETDTRDTYNGSTHDASNSQNPMYGGQDDGDDTETDTRDTPNSSQSSEAMGVIDDCKEKFFYFMRHRSRVKCQREYCDLLEEQLRKECERTKKTSNAFIVIDWKMKFEPMSSRETMPENFGKRGLPWHGVAVIYFVWDEVLQVAVKKVMYIDQIVDKCSKQDALAVVSLLEATIAAIKTNVPEIMEAVICSDNAGCYTSKFLLVMVALMNAKYGDQFFVSRVIHTETQDGKGIVDRHFAVNMRHIGKYMVNAKANRIIRINTSRGLAYALQWNNGVQNSIVQFVEFDRELLEKFAKTLTKLSNQMKKYFSRISDVEFEHPTAVDQEVLSKMSDPESFFGSELAQGFKSTIKVRSHSGYGLRVNFAIDFEKLKVTPDENGMKEYNLLLGMAKDTTEDIDDEGDDINDDDSAYLDCSLNQNGELTDDINDLDDFEFGDRDGDGDGERNETDEDILHLLEESIEELQSSVNIPEERPYRVPTDEEFIVCNTLTRCEIKKTSYLLRKEKLPSVKKSTKGSCNKTANQPILQKRKDVLAMGVRYASTYISGDGVVDARDDQLEIYNLARNFTLRPIELPFAGFARRDNGGGDLFGARHIGPFKVLVTDMVNKGNKDKAYKMSPAQVLEEIQRQNPGKLSLPTMYEIQCYINQVLVQGNKSSGDNEGEITDKSPSEESDEPTQDVFSQSVKIWLQERLYGDINAKPVSLSVEMIEFFPSLTQLPRDKLKKKISAVKQKLKSTAWKQIT